MGGKRRAACLRPGPEAKTSPHAARQADDGEETDPEAKRRLGANQWERCKVEACRRAGEGNHGPGGLFLFSCFTGSTIGMAGQGGTRRKRTRVGTYYNHL